MFFLVKCTSCFFFVSWFCVWIYDEGHYLFGDVLVAIGTIADVY